MKRTHLTVTLLTLALASAACPAQESNATSDKYVTRDEYEKVLKELDSIKARLKADDEKAAAGAKESEEAVDEIEKELKSVKSLAGSAQPGLSKPLVTGYGSVGYTDREGEEGTFNAGFNPIFLWKYSDRIFFEGELELELDGGETELELEYANISYIASDYMTLKAGKFLAPFGTFAERLHPAWINKLPDAPLPFGHDGIAPTSEIGFQASGGAAVGPTKFNYALYVSNGPRLNMGDDEEEETGMLHFDNNLDINNSKAVGGRIGFLPIPELELGYSVQYAGVGEDVEADAWLHSADLSYVRDVPRLKGSIDVRAQWVWSDVDDLTYDEDGSLGFGPLTFNNRRDGGYAQLAYRPSKIDGFVKDLEGVVRWDTLNRPGGAPMDADEDRWTLGLNYWFSPSTVVKAAYQFGERRSSMEGKENVSAFLIQAAMGF